MIASITGTGLQQTTSYKVVLPFYAYAALSFLTACILLLFHTDVFGQHYFHPHILAITHLMALGWGTMIILGASHQLVPVLVEGKLSSDFLAYTSFIFTAIGIPFLVVGFYIFHTGWVLKAGAVLINLGVISYLTNVFSSIYESKKADVYAFFIGMATLWLFATVFFGLLLVFNFTIPLLPDNSVEYLAIHAHMGLAGWFLLLVIGVGARLIPMFLISKYTSNKMLWWIFALINLSLISFIFLRTLRLSSNTYFASLFLAFCGLILFANYCYKAYQVRIRKSVDEQMKMSLLSVLQMLFPVSALMIVLVLLPSGIVPNLAMLYGFCIFFGWITAIILGMTFKTLPFIVWNKVYHKRAGQARTPVPKDLFNEKIFSIMSWAYLAGFIVFISGIISLKKNLLTLGAAALLMAALLYVVNVGITLFHQPEKQ